jgi:hypothetical protein
MSIYAHDVANPLGPLRALFSRMVTVADLAAAPLETVNPGARAQDVVETLKARDFDIAGVSSDPLTRFVTRDALDDWQGRVAGAARPILAVDCIERSMPLAELIELLNRRPYAFVLDGDHVHSVVTRADLQAPAVSVVVLGFLTALELGLRQLVEADLPAGWVELLPAGRRAKVEALYEQKRRANVATGIEDCLYLADWLTVTRRSPATLARLGYSSAKSFERATSSFGSLRNALAHGGTMLDEGDPLDAIARVGRVIDLTEAVWAQVERLAAPWDAYAQTVITAQRRRLTGLRSIRHWPYTHPVHIITAWNPGSVVRSRAANEAANGQLQQRLERHGMAHAPAIGASPDKRWREAGFLVERLHRVHAAELGAEFGQISVFEITADELLVVACPSGETMRAVPRS